MIAVAVTGLDIDRRDDPVARHLLLDAKDPVVALCNVLACDEGEQFGRTDTADRQLFVVDRRQCRQAVAYEVVDEGFSCSPVIPVTRRLAWSRVVVVAQKDVPDLSCERARGLVEAT